MLTITPETLKLVSQLGSIRPSPSAVAGKKSRSYSYTFQYDGGNHLSFWCTDNCTTVLSRVPVVGTDASWICSLESRSLDHLAKYCDGGRLTIRRVNDTTLSFERKTLLYRIPCQPETCNPLTQVLSENGPHTTVSTSTLKAILEFLATGATNKDLKDRMQTCTLSQDGCAMGADARRRMFKTVILVANGPALPFDISVRRSSIQAILRWITILSKHSSLAFQQLDIIDLTATAKPRFCFCDPSGVHRLWVPAISQPFLRAIIDRTLGTQPAFTIRVNHRRLWSFAHLAPKSDLSFTVTSLGGDKANLVVCAPLANDCLPATVNVVTAGSTVAGCFEVNARSLNASLQHFTDEEIGLVYRPGCRWLGVCSAARLGTTWTAGHEAFCAVKRPATSAGADSPESAVMASNPDNDQQEDHDAHDRHDEDTPKAGG